MNSLWTWIGRHQRLMALVSGGVAILILVAGVGVGLARGSPQQSTLVQGPLQAQPVAAKVPEGRHSIVGVIRAVGPNEVLVRSQRGVYFAVKWGPGSHFRSAGQEIKPAALRPGQAVVVIGKPAADGSLAASYITVVPRPVAPTTEQSQ
jgi:hypothetical protein